MREKRVYLELCCEYINIGEGEANPLTMTEELVGNPFAYSTMQEFDQNCDNN
jgi:hypothetical protein